MDKVHTDNINQLTQRYLDDVDFRDLSGRLSTYVNENCADLEPKDKVKVIAQTIPLLFGLSVADKGIMQDGCPLPEVVQAISDVVNDVVFDTFVAETKIELTEENKSDIQSFFMGKDNWQSDEYRKQGLATLIEALLKSYNAL